MTLLVTGSLAAPPSPAAPCEICYAKEDELRGFIKLEADYKSLLDRNQKFLVTIQNDTSKAIKVKSNILVLIVRLETLKNNIEANRGEVHAKGCIDCLKSRIQKM